MGRPTLNPGSNNKESGGGGSLPRYLALAAFVVQHAALMLGLRFSAIHANPNDSAISSTEVFVTELVKLVLSMTISFVVDSRCNVYSFVGMLEKAFVDEGVDILKLCVPAVLYTIQNNLQYVIETAPLFMVMYQMKIVTTAIFYSYMLSRRLTVRDWLTIIALAFGVSMVQSSQTDVHIHHASNFIGVLSVIFACLSSGFAGVYFEKTLKSSKSSIWMINIELSLLSTALAMFACLVEDTEEISRRGFFHGWNHWVVLVIFLQAGAGLVVALVVKFSDNIYKGFAGGISTVLTIVMDYVFFDDTDITKSFLLGTLIVLLSTAAFQSSQARKEATGSQAPGLIAGGTVSSSTAVVSGSGNSILLVEAGLGTTRERLVSIDGTTTSGSGGTSSGGGSPTHGGSIEGGGIKTNGKAPHLRWVQRLGVGNNT